MSESVGECAVCGCRETVAAVELPPRALQLMRHGRAVNWRAVADPARVGFCESDWEFVVELVDEQGTNPLPQCNAKYAVYDECEESAVDHFDLETTMWTDCQAVLAGETDGEPSVRSRVGAQLVTWSLETLVETSR